jgi:multidrug efflux pump subunit AcrA (membrane-fusion protein)
MTGTLTEVGAAPVASAGADAAAGGADAGSRYAVRVLIEQPDPQARLGMAATAQIRTDNTPNALVLPLRAIREENGQTYVARIIPNQATTDGTPPQTEQVNVTVGARTPDGVEIVDGLQEGDQVLSQMVRFPTPTPTGGA